MRSGYRKRKYCGKCRPVCGSGGTVIGEWIFTEKPVWTVADPLVREKIREMDDDKNPVPMEVTVSGDAGEAAELTIPEDAAAGDTIHVILECVDGGGTNPVAYQRAIITVQ